MVSEGLKGTLIEPMTEADLPEVIEIERASFTMPWTEMSFFNQIKNPRCISKLARVGGRIAGYICASRLLDEGHILTFAVHPEYRRLGIASALITDMLNRLEEEECRFIFLEVRVSNGAARKIYEKCGFSELATRKNYYVSPVEDAVMMVLKFGETDAAEK